MQLRIAVPRGAVVEGGGEEAIAGDELGAAGTAPGPARLALHVVERGFDGAVVGVHDRLAGLRATERPGERD